MAQQIWTDEDRVFSTTEIGFLVRKHFDLQRRDVWVLSDRPAHTNQSHQPRLYGWCGTTDDISVNAEGLGRVVRVAKNGRARLVRVDVTPAALEALGYPELSE